MRGRKTVVILVAVALMFAVVAKAMAAEGKLTKSTVEKRMQKMIDSGGCVELGAAESMPAACSTYYGQCFYKKFPISSADCKDEAHSNRPLVKNTAGACVPVSLEEIQMNGPGYLINKTSCGNENSSPNGTACKQWGKSYLGPLNPLCQVRMYWKEIYYCAQNAECSSPSSLGYYDRGVYRGSSANYEKGDVGNGYCERQEYEMGYYYFITAHQAEMQLTCRSEEYWRSVK